MNFLSMTFSISKILGNRPSTVSALSTVSQLEFSFLVCRAHLLWRQFRYCAAFFLPIVHEEQSNAILWQPVAYPSNFKEKETAMFQKLMNTTDDFVMTLLRLALGIVFFAHGAQKALGWFGGFGFRATLGFFTQQMRSEERRVGKEWRCRRSADQ